MRDLEELLHSIQRSSSKDFMKEAIRCYNAGAYRAAVVISVAAGMDDLRMKLNEFVNDGGASPNVVAMQKDIEKIYKDQKAYESILIENCEKKADMLTPAEARKLELMLKNRHLCAHPSGHIPGVHPRCCIQTQNWIQRF